jgi:hypothetical protein
MRLTSAPSAQRAKISTNDGGFGLVNGPFDVGTLSVRSEDLDVVVAEHPAASHLPGFGLPKHRVVRALPGLFSLELVGERRQREHDLVGRTVEGALAVLEVKEHPHAGRHELLQRVGRLDRFAAEPRLLRHDQYLERRPWFQRIHQPEEPRPVGKLSPADTIVDVDVRVGDGPAFSGCERSGVVHLTGDRFLVVGDPGLIG